GVPNEAIKAICLDAAVGGHHAEAPIERKDCGDLQQQAADLETVRKEPGDPGAAWAIEQRTNGSAKCDQPPVCRGGNGPGPSLAKIEADIHRFFHQYEQRAQAVV